jgi:hypothetical protein
MGCAMKKDVWKVKVSEEEHQQLIEERRQRRAETCQEINEKRNKEEIWKLEEEYQHINEERH